MGALEAGAVAIKTSGEGRVRRELPAAEHHEPVMKGRVPPGHEGARGETRAAVGARVTRG